MRWRHSSEIFPWILEAKWCLTNRIPWVSFMIKYLKTSVHYNVLPKGKCGTVGTTSRPWLHLKVILSKSKSCDSRLNPHFILLCKSSIWSPKHIFIGKFSIDLGWHYLLRCNWLNSTSLSVESWLPLVALGCPHAWLFKLHTHFPRVFNFLQLGEEIAFKETKNSNQPTGFRLIHI